MIYTSKISPIMGGLVESERKEKTSVELPNELTLNVFLYLNNQDLMAAERVCKDWQIIQRKYAKELDFIWKKKFFSDYKDSMIINGLTSKENYFKIKKLIAENPGNYFKNTITQPFLYDKLSVQEKIERTFPS